MPNFSNRVDLIAGEGAAAWDIHFRATKAAAAGEDVIVMSVGDPDFSTPQPIVQRAIDALKAGDTHYAEVQGRETLRKAIADDMNALGAPNYGPENIAVLAGTQNGLFASSLLLLEPGDEVIALDPMYVTYEAFLKVSGAHLVRVECDEALGFRPDPDAIEQAITPKTQAIAFSNPNNPTGTVMTREELMAIGDIAKRHDLWVIADEVYAHLTFENEHVCMAGLPDMAERTVTVSSLSKSHAMTGWRVGWLAGPEALADHADNLALCMLYGLPGFIQEAATLALQEGRHFSEEMRDTYRHRRDVVLSELEHIERLKVLTPQSGMFVLVDVSATGMTALEFARRLFASEGVSVLDGAAFGPNASNYVRLSFTQSDEVLRKGCSRIAHFVDHLGHTA